MGTFQYRADSRLNNKIRVDKISVNSFITWQLAISNELNPATVNEKNIKVFDAAGVPQKVKVLYDKDNGSIVITQNFKCAYNTSYTLLVENVRCQEGYSFQKPLSVNYAFVENDDASKDFQGLPSLSASMKKLSSSFNLNLDARIKPVDPLSMILSLIAIAALIFGLFPYQAISTLGSIIWMLLSLSLTAVPIAVLIMCNRKKHTHNTKVPKIISIVVLVGFGAMNILSALGIPLYFSFIPVMRI